MHLPKALAFFATIFVLLASQMIKANEWDDATEAIIRLAPQEFTSLPRHIIEKLTTQGCTIPQAFAATSPHNVIKGEFVKSGQQDWAVLCSRQQTSSILLFWGGETSCPSELLPSPDRKWLQHTGEGISYSRIITAVSPESTFKHLEANKESTIASIRHHGINQSFVGKGSSVQYCHQGHWVELPGAD